jgi:hypothetical protein
VSQDAIGPRLRLPIHALVPARLAPDRQRRVGRVALAGDLVISLVDRRADLVLSLDNRARDYDLRLIAHLGDGSRAWSGAPFGVEERGEELDHSTPGAPQQWLPDFPFRGWLSAQSTDGTGLAVFARGLYEAAVRRSSGWLNARSTNRPGGVDLCQTLLRGVGWLSRADLHTRPGHAGPPLATPAAQCLGPQRWELALRPFAATEFALLPVLAEQFLRPAAVFPIQWSAGSDPAECALFADADPHLVVSALRPADTLNPGAMLHAYNPTQSARSANVSGERARLDETPTEQSGPLHPFEIAAWRLQPQ